MSASVELQTAIYNALLADAGVAALVGDRVYDGAPSNREYPCITFGPMDSVPDDMECITASSETVQLDIWSREQGRLRPCKEICSAVKKALHDADLGLTVNALVQIRTEGMRVFLDADGRTAHGVVTVMAELEEA
ncbi:DUF3168 domain-containing protein [Pseudophaeobacter sp. C1-32P7]|uniref:DUF3168 domain-containing protein n=1 Tax=Pseudophaeobacter sp. C1-32P7 TaxID=3098142 RepID=UPI0034D4F8E2